MIELFAPLLAVLGGFLMSFLIDDETGMYGSWFVAVASVIFLFAGVLFSTSFFFVVIGAFLGAIAGVLLFHGHTGVLAVLLGVIAFGSSWSFQLVTLSLIPSVGYLFGKGQRKQLFWFVLVPMVIFSLTFFF